MIDNNGLPMSMIQPYCEAGYENVIFSPNHWNPLMSKTWACDALKDGYLYNTEAAAGGARIDFRYTSNNPMLFFWEDEYKNRLLVWGPGQYHNGGFNFGLKPLETTSIDVMESAMLVQLPLLDKKYPYDSWLVVCYADDQMPSTLLLKSIEKWNNKWQYPKLKMLANADDLFNHMREKYIDIIPTVRGDFTGGWYQHPVSTAELLADKFEVDRLLANTETFCTLASLVDENYEFPKTEIDRAWYYLLLNDEHSYGTSGYQGRRVYETWLQHRDWIEKAGNTAKLELNRAFYSLSGMLGCDCNGVVAFNCTNKERKELIEKDNKYAFVNVPSLGYAIVDGNSFLPLNKGIKTACVPPVVENSFYKIEFNKNGSIKSLYDKELDRELVDTDNKYGVNELVYTKDNHNSFFTPEECEFEVYTSDVKTEIVVKCFFEKLGASVVQTVTLPSYDKRVDFDNKIMHASDMINTDRYYRYLYIAFPFLVENPRRLCHMNGCVAEYAKSTSGYCTDVYMASDEWCCSENDDFGVALVLYDSYLMEFDRIHPDKTDFGNAGEGSGMFAYLANDWLQMHCAGGSHLDFHFRFSVISYGGDYKKCGIPEKAMMLLNPVFTRDISEKNGRFCDKSGSFVSFDCDKRLLTLKPAEDNDGIICRFYGENCNVEIMKCCEEMYYALRNTVDERDALLKNSDGFVTYRFGKGKLTTKIQKDVTFVPQKGQVSPIGTVFTGLVTKPRAIRGENEGHLYLLWGANTEEGFSHYKLYRSETAGFSADKSTFIADIYPEEYCVGRYVDQNLKKHTCYYYRVCAVNNDGICGELSEEFSAFTKE